MKKQCRNWIKKNVEEVNRKLREIDDYQESVSYLNDSILRLMSEPISEEEKLEKLLTLRHVSYLCNSLYYPYAFKVSLTKSGVGKFIQNITKFVKKNIHELNDPYLLIKDDGVNHSFFYKDRFLGKFPTTNADHILYNFNVRVDENLDFNILSGFLDSPEISSTIRSANYLKNLRTLKSRGII